MFPVEYNTFFVCQNLSDNKRWNEIGVIYIIHVIIIHNFRIPEVINKINTFTTIVFNCNVIKFVL